MGRRPSRRPQPPAARAGTARLRPIAVALLALMPAAAGAETGESASIADPLEVRNLSPVTQLFGLPRAQGRMASPGELETSLLVEHANNFTADADGDTAVLFDGTTTVTSLTMRGAFRTRWEWGLALPYVHHDGGFSDGLIDGFHDLFGLPDGHRGDVPRDRLDYRVVHEGREVVRVTGDQGGLGDVRLWLGLRVHDTPARQAVVRAMVKLPTGQAGDLTGSDGTDTSLWIELADRSSLAALGVTITLAAGITRPGDDGLGLPQRNLVGSAHLGLHYPLAGRVTLRAQLDGHTDVIDAGVTPLGRGALLGSLGGSIRLSQPLTLDLALVEDLTPDRAPDVVFMTTLRAHF